MSPKASPTLVNLVQAAQKAVNDAIVRARDEYPTPGGGSLEANLIGALNQAHAPLTTAVQVVANLTRG